MSPTRALLSLAAALGAMLGLTALVWFGPGDHGLMMPHLMWALGLAAVTALVLIRLVRLDRRIWWTIALAALGGAALVFVKFAVTVTPFGWAPALCVLAAAAVLVRPAVRAPRRPRDWTR
ncbi:hypothetical protein [Actinomadura algeriensis]|uniref:Peptidoglycan/LPS O-acetylase OafA/YrhL n=1 Tax=Actinomadura algeriensis TaxID=1679523 RepID=A0ABR9JPH1_9ACTN|nr:hypothetical protein [Actinomadura algeriensis]MBE1532452.1 peptidoglycan/LPS O-acetylase OafA/YrhL [Actinomadura algeriensis]